MNIKRKRTPKMDKVLESRMVELPHENPDPETLIHALLEQQVSTKELPPPTFGQRAADKMAHFAGSWGFVFSFLTVMLLWILINNLLLKNPFDPFPFILLNLCLSCVAAIQAPLIMMSQNRQEEKVRERAENDYQINLKAEVIIEDLHNKLDRILENQAGLEERLSKLEQGAQPPR